MPVHPLKLFPDGILSQPCQPISDFHAGLAKIIQDLRDTLHRSPGVGLAAPQIGISKQVSLIDTRRGRRRAQKGADSGEILLINPMLLEGRGEQVPREGCLSIPDLLANVRRFQFVTVHTRTLDGGETRITAEGFEALALQHEIDHLNGILFLDRVRDLKTDVFRRRNY